ncbi:MAG: hypothetical protein LC114_19635 [Bryobacterales bacterium]|nr:hypothetical protein [Bryobacterales bacterium]
MKSNRKRNVARKPKSNKVHAGSPSTPLNQGSPHGQTSVATPSGFASQNIHPDAVQSQPEPASGFVSQNRINAQHSTGPRTPEGKAISSQNALKHGLSIQRHAVLHGENPALYAQLLAELREIYEPISRREDLAVEDIAQCRWALARFDEAEAVCLEKLTGWINDLEAFPEEEPVSTGESLGHAATVLTDFDDKDRRYVEPDTHYPTFDKIHRYRTYWERKHTRALAEFDRARRDRRAEAAELRAEAAELRAREQARRQAEAHALKQQISLAREARQQELHELRRTALRIQHSTATAKLAPPNETSAALRDSFSSDTARTRTETILTAPTPATTGNTPRPAFTPSENGFVSQNAGLPREKAAAAVSTAASHPAA